MPGLVWFKLILAYFFLSGYLRFEKNPPGNFFSGQGDGM